MNKIKLIWDFYGEDSFNIALHHQKHLIEFLQSINYQLQISEVITLDQFNNYTYIIIKEEDMIYFRDTLKPKRAEIYEN